MAEAPLRDPSAPTQSEADTHPTAPDTFQLESSGPRDWADSKVAICMELRDSTTGGCPTLEANGFVNMTRGASPGSLLPGVILLSPTCFSTTVSKDLSEVIL
jgi:hypothetical protein